MPRVPTASETDSSLAARLNRKCFCVTLDGTALSAALSLEAGEPGFSETFMASRPHLFSNVPVFLAASVLDEMQAIVIAVEATAKLRGYRETVLSWCRFQLPISNVKMPCTG
ncbi:hypothetical protein [Rhizobium lusitanum]|uniref:hypothetical protein n=1 Tax=Rhizobium lusitanum TaxID=293958 RepID=UPI00161C38DE|nr:hypothetical protein [Rhizobium lusitanum]